MTVTVKRLGEAGDAVLAKVAPDVFDEPIDAPIEDCLPDRQPATHSFLFSEAALLQS